MICHYGEWNYGECGILFSVMLSVIVLNVIMLSVMAPLFSGVDLFKLFCVVFGKLEINIMIYIKVENLLKKQYTVISFLSSLPSNPQPLLQSTQKGSYVLFLQNT